MASLWGCDGSSFYFYLSICPDLLECSFHTRNDLFCSANTLYPVLLTEPETVGIHRFGKKIYYQFDFGDSFCYSSTNTIFLFEAIFNLNLLKLKDKRLFITDARHKKHGNRK